MKILSLLVFSVLCVGSISCKKGTQGPLPFTPVPFTETQYNYSGTYSTTGRPDYLLKPDSLSKGLLSFIESNLPEQVDITKTNPAFLSANSDIKIERRSEINITFVSEGAGQLNTLGYYTYPTGTPPLKAADIREIKYLFPNASLSWGGGGLIPGDKVKMGNFDPGTSIGFVLIARGWDIINKKVDTKGYHFCSNEILNPENDPTLKKHTVLINFPEEGKIFIGFEDTMRTDPSCDNDFNDLVIYAKVIPL